jgi:hypothetical protein
MLCERQFFQTVVFQQISTARTLGISFIPRTRCIRLYETKITNRTSVPIAATSLLVMKLQKAKNFQHFLLRLLPAETKREGLRSWNAAPLQFEQRQGLRILKAIKYPYVEQKLKPRYQVRLFN